MEIWDADKRRLVRMLKAKRKRRKAKARFTSKNAKRKVMPEASRLPVEDDPVGNSQIRLGSGERP